MKKIIVSLWLLCPLCAWAATPIESIQEQAIEQVKEYCTLMSQFAGNADNIDKVDKIVALCENNRVSTFDDFKQNTHVFTERPLFDYLQNITLTYENNVQIDYSQYQYEGTFSAPSTFNGIPGDTYMKILVTKKMRGKGVNKTIRNIITVNTATMKIGGTVDEGFQSPYGIYIEGIKAMQKKEYDKAEELLKKASQFEFFSHRYRAKIYLGLLYQKRGKLNEGFQALIEVGENDPLAEFFLSTIYYLDGPAEFKDVAKALQIIEKNVAYENKDFPQINDIYKFELVLIHNGFHDPNITPNIDKAIKLCKELSGSENKQFAINSNFLLIAALIKKEDIQSILPYCKKYSASDLSTYTPSQFQVYETSKCQLYKQYFPQKYQEEINTLKQSFTQHGWVCTLVGDSYINKKDYASAHTMYLKGAELQDGNCAYRLFLLYHEGVGVSQSRQTAWTWLNKAGDYNCPDALYILGNAYYLGDFNYDIEPDIQKAISYLKRAAAQGASNATLLLDKISSERKNQR